MLYHDHPVLMKPYQMYTSKQQQPQEAGGCTCMFKRQPALFSLAGFIGVLFDVLISAEPDLGGGGYSKMSGLQVIMCMNNKKHTYYSPIFQFVF